MVRACKRRRDPFGAFAALPVELVHDILFALLVGDGDRMALHDCYAFFQTCSSAAALKPGWFVHASSRLQLCESPPDDAERGVQRLVLARDSVCVALDVVDEVRALTARNHGLSFGVPRASMGALPFPGVHEFCRKQGALKKAASQAHKSMVAATLKNLMRVQPMEAERLWAASPAARRLGPSVWVFFIRHHRHLDSDYGGLCPWDFLSLQPIHALATVMAALRNFREVHAARGNGPVAAWVRATMATLAHQLYLARHKLHALVLPRFYALALTCADNAAALLRGAAELGVRLDADAALDGLSCDYGGLVPPPYGSALRPGLLGALAAITACPPQTFFDKVIGRVLDHGIHYDTYFVHTSYLKQLLCMFQPEWGVQRWQDFGMPLVENLFPDILAPGPCSCPNPHPFRRGDGHGAHWLVSHFVLDTGIPELIALPRVRGERHSALLHNFPAVAMQHPNSALMPVPTLEELRRMDYFRHHILAEPTDTRFMLEWLHARGILFGQQEWRRLQDEHPDLAPSMQHLFHGQ